VGFACGARELRVVAGWRPSASASLAPSTEPSTEACCAGDRAGVKHVKHVNGNAGAGDAIATPHHTTPHHTTPHHTTPHHTTPHHTTPHHTTPHHATPHQYLLPVAAPPGDRWRGRRGQRLSVVRLAERKA